MLRICKSISPFDICILNTVNKHIHTRHRDCRTVYFLSIHLYFIETTLTSCTNQERTRSTRGIVYAVVFLGGNDLSHNFRYLLGSEEASRFLTRHRRKFANHILIRIADNVGRDLTFFGRNIARSEVKICEVIKQVTKNRILLLLLAEIALAVKVDTPEYAIQNCICTFNAC